MIRKLNYFGELYVDDGGHVIVKTKNGNMFTLDNVTDLTTIEAKGLLVGPQKIEEEDDEIDDNTKQVVKYAKQKMMMKKWGKTIDDTYTKKAL